MHVDRAWRELTALNATTATEVPTAASVAHVHRQTDTTSGSAICERPVSDGRGIVVGVSGIIVSAEAAAVLSRSDNSSSRTVCGDNSTGSRTKCHLGCLPRKSYHQREDERSVRGILIIAEEAAIIEEAIFEGCWLLPEQLSVNARFHACR